MSTYKRLRIKADDLEVSAFILPESTSDALEDTLCKKCAPKKTKLKQLVGVVEFGKTSDRFYTVFLCTRCKRQWAVPYFVARSESED